MLFEHVHVLTPEGTILPDQYILTWGEQIISVTSQPPSETCGEVIRLGNALALPGFINTHCHVAMTLMRSLGSGLPLSSWLNRVVFPAEKKLTPQYVKAGALLGIAEMLKNGITSFSDMYYFCDAIGEAVLESGISANLSHSISYQGSDFATSQAFAKARSVRQDWDQRENGRIRADYCLHSEYTTTDETVRLLSEAAYREGSHIQLHLSETAEEVEACKKRHHGMTPPEYFQSMGVFRSPVTAAHCVFLTDKDRSILARNGVSVSHCPSSNLKLGSGIADIEKLYDSGINVTIGTDGAASNDRLSVLEEARLMSLLAKGVHQNPAILPARSALNAATCNGALAQGRADTGKILAGKKADLCFLNLDQPNLLPCSDLVNQTLYAGGNENILMTVCRGKIVYDRGVYPTIDLEKVRAEVNRGANVIFS